MVVVHVAAVEEGDLLRELRLFCRHGFKPAAEGAVRIFRQTAVMVDFERRIQQPAHRLQGGGGIDDRRERRREATHQIGVAQYRVTQRRFLRTVAGAGALDDIAYFHVRRAGNFAAFAVDAVFQRLVVERAILQAQTLPVGTGLFRAGIARIDAADRANRGADRAFDTAFKLGVVHCAPSLRWIICSATCSAVTAQTPPPQPCATGSYPPRTEPMA